MILYAVFRDEFFQGEMIERNLAGIFDTLEGAEEAIYELETVAGELYDPTARTLYTTVPVELNTIVEVEE